jgi:FkbM family methyltransferase
VTPSKFVRLVDGQSGRWLTFAQDQWITPTLALYGTYSEAEVALCRQYLTPGDEVIVVGANIGAVAVPLAHHVWPGRVTCFEPQRLMAQALGANALLHGCDNVYIVEAAVGATAGSVRLTPADPRTPANTGGVEVGVSGTQMVPLEYLDGWYDGPAPRLLHIDAEGNEPAVLRGAEAMIRAGRPVIVAEIDREAARVETLALLRSFGYERLYEHRPPLIGGVVSINVVAVPDGVPAPLPDGHLAVLP